MLGELMLSELGLWTALWQVNPWGEMRADHRAAIGTSLLANINRDAARQPDPFRVRDFMPYLPQDVVGEARELADKIMAALAPGKPQPQDKATRSERRRQMKAKKK